MKMLLMLFLVFFVTADIFSQEMIVELHKKSNECTIISVDKHQRRSELGTYDIVFPKQNKLFPVIGVVEESALFHSGEKVAQGKVTLKMFGVGGAYRFYIKSVKSIQHIRKSYDSYYMEQWNLKDFIGCLDGARAKIFIRD